MLPFPTAPFRDGIIIGHLGTTTARIAVHLSRPAEPHLLVVDSAAGPRAVEVTAKAETDGIAVIDLRDLEPDLGHTVDVLRDGRSILPERGRFRTLDPGGERVAFAFLSCDQPFVNHEGRAAIGPSAAIADPFLEAIGQRDARFVLHVGDQVYADLEDVPSLDLWGRALAAHRRGEAVDALGLYRALYRGFRGVPGTRRILSRAGHLMIWDDGEIRDVWGSVPLDLEEAGLAPTLFAAAQRTYREHQHATNPTTAPEDLHYSFEAGPAAFFVLDLRGRRDFAREILLGERQWRDLEAWLEATERCPFRFVVSSVPLLHTPDSLVERITRRRNPLAKAIPAAFHDRWSAAAFHGELERLLGLLFGREGIVLLSGDIHIGAAIDIEGPAGTPPIPQWISSAFTNRAALLTRLESQVVSRVAPAGSRWRLRPHFHEILNNFGIVEVARRGDRWVATFELWAHREGRAEPLYRVTAERGA